MNKRVAEIDYLKCVFILLMIAFHLVFFSDKYPWVKQWVYTFHMPAFLILSGYLMRIEKRPGEFGRMMVWILIPYLIMEAGYVVLSAVLPVREKVDGLSVGLLLDKLCLHPMGPYWYLHTFMLCGVAYHRLEVLRGDPALVGREYLGPFIEKLRLLPRLKAYVRRIVHDYQGDYHADRE